MLVGMNSAEILGMKECMVFFFFLLLVCSCVSGWSLMCKFLIKNMTSYTIMWDVEQHASTYS